MKYLPLVSRSLIALLFVIAGVQKLMNFGATSENIASLGLPAAGLVTLLVIIIEIPVAVAFAYGYKKCATGGTLIAFTVLATLLVHRDWSNSLNMIMSLKNLAVIGGILAVIGGCDCGKCPVSKHNGHHG